MPFDYKKEYREFYLPPKIPHLITIPRMNFVAVHGKGDPNVPGGAYQEAMGVLYGIAFTIKMSYKGRRRKRLIGPYRKQRQKRKRIFPRRNS